MSNVCLSIRHIAKKSGMLSYFPVCFRSDLGPDVASFSHNALAIEARWQLPKVGWAWLSYFSGGAESVTVQ